MWYHTNYVLKGYVMENEIKYHRKKPIKEFDINQTMYSLITNESKDYMNYPAVGFMGKELVNNKYSLKLVNKIN